MLRTNVFALVVCFHPDEHLLIKLVARLSKQVAELWILNNGGISPGLENQILNYPNLHMHTFKGNVGIATALNLGFSIAARHQAEFVVTFDQDSEPPDDHVEILTATWHALARQGGQKIGAIGPSFFDVRNGVVQYPFHRLDVSGLKVNKIYRQAGQDIVPVDFLITSGMLVPVSMWAQGLKFRDELFVDYVDTEWCLRASAAGFTHFGCFLVSMRHQVSDASTFSFFGLRVFKYNPIRRYYYYRNSVFFIMNPLVSFGYKLRLGVGLVIRLLFLPFVDDKPIDSVVYSLHGLVDGILGKAGPIGH